MSDTELLMKAIEELPPGYVPRIFDFIDQLKHNAPPVSDLRSADAPVNPYTAGDWHSENEERERLKNLDVPLRRKYPTLLSMIGSCKGLDTMDEYFARKQAEKERERRQERRYGEEEQG
jgi:hypothetical protein